MNSSTSSLKQIGIFGAIGILNTCIDVGIYLFLRHLYIPVLLANIISTSVALTVSFSLNRRYTFQSTSKGRRTIVLFLLVTLSGLWVIQPIIIHIILSLLRIPLVSHSLDQIVANATSFRDLISKLAATPATLLWNYILYRKIVFKKNLSTSETTAVS
ncbi:MAG: GtrA family protein [Candidatus Saccharimonadales bacterium]